jgi:hypothetical protein
MALKEHKGLLTLFSSSFEGSTFNIDTFDVDFFLDSAKDLLLEEESGSTK